MEKPHTGWDDCLNMLLSCYRKKDVCLEQSILEELSSELSFINFFFQVICELNVQIAFFRDLLIHIGTPKDSAELRERIRRVRRQCVEGCKQTNCQLLPLIKRYVTTEQTSVS